MQIASPSSATAATGQPYSRAKAELEQAAKAFEAIFARQMIGAMRSASLDEGLGDSSATEQFRNISDARTADNMAELGGLGIAAMLLKQFQAAVAPPTPATGAENPGVHNPADGTSGTST